MTLSNRLGEIAAMKRSGGRIYRDVDTLFVLSHMRGFTTLLSHILGSHPAVAGYFETHANYRELKDLLRLRTTLDDADGLNGEEQWVVDKLLGLELTISNEILRREDVTLLFTLRRPSAALKSLFATRDRYGWRMDRERAIGYYFERLPQLANLARRASGGYYLDAEAIVEDTDRALAQLTSALRLRSPLRPVFEPRSLTGKRGFGCPSDYIKQGRIVRKRDPYDEIEIERDLLARAERAWLDCRETLLEHCTALALVDGDCAPENRPD